MKHAIKRLHGLSRARAARKQLCSMLAGSCCEFRLTMNSLCSLGCCQTHGDPPTSASKGLGFQVCATMSRLQSWFFKELALIKFLCLMDSNHE